MGKGALEYHETNSIKLHSVMWRVPTYSKEQEMNPQKGKRSKIIAKTIRNKDPTQLFTRAKKEKKEKKQKKELIERIWRCIEAIFTSNYTYGTKKG